MSKKMKGVVLGSSPNGVYEDARTRFKHQTLLQDYQQLQKEAEASRKQLETMKWRKLTLLAEVRFLRQRHKYLLRNKSQNLPQEREFVQPQNVETHRKTSMKNRVHNKKDATLRNIPPIFNLTQKGRVYMGTEAEHQNAPPKFGLNQKETIHSGKKATPHSLKPISDLNHQGRMYRGREAAFRNPLPVIDLNQKEMIYNGNGAVLQNPAPVFDLNQNESSHGEAGLQSRAPIFDLNQISREEEEFQDNNEPLRFEEPKKCLIRGGNDEQHNDLKISVCRNVGNGSSRAGKRKISWQDPVALRV